MKFVTKKTNLFFAIIVLALSNSFTAKAAQLADQHPSNLVNHFFLIKNKTIARNTKLHELENQISPVMAEINSVPDIHEQLINQLLEITIEVAQQEKEEAKTLKDELDSLHFTATTSEEIARIPYHTKENILRSLNFETVTIVFDRIGEKIFSGKNPFRIPTNTSNVSQLDMFFLLGITLTMQETNPIQDELHSALMSCVGLKNVIKIQQRLHKPEISEFIPKSLLTKFFNTRNPLKIAAIVKHVMGLASTYSN